MEQTLISEQLRIISKSHVCPALALLHSSPFSSGALHLSAPLPAPTLLISSMMAKHYFFVREVRAVWSALHHIRINLQKAPFATCALFLLSALSTETHTGSRTNVLH